MLVSNAHPRRVALAHGDYLERDKGQVDGSIGSQSRANTCVCNYE